MLTTQTNCHNASHTAFQNGLNDHIREAVNGRSPLHCFTVWLKNRNHEDAIGFADELLSLGARPDSIDRELMPARLTPLHYSLIYDNAELATHFVKNVEKIEWNKIKDAMPSAFLIACGQTSTSIDLLRCLSENDDRNDVFKAEGLESLSKVEITKRFAKGTALHVAAECGRDDTLRFLLENAKWDSDTIDRKRQDGLAALHLAARMGSTSTVQILIESGASLDVVTDDQGETALFYAVRGANASLVKCLVEAMSETTRSIVNKQGLSARDLCENLFSDSVDEQKEDEEEEEEDDEEEEEKKEEDESEVSIVLRTMREFCKTDSEKEKFRLQEEQRKKEEWAARLITRAIKRNFAMKKADKRRRERNAS